MVLDAESCYRALRAHDARFDGVFFAAITSTGIYCRPICPARPALRRNCRFFATSAAAERDGFRPCLRCRPELAPGNAPVDAPASIATAALRRIEEGALDHQDLEGFAAGFGLTSRHLRRCLEAEYGVSPADLAQTRRLLTAKQLLTETALPVVDVAFASGFASLRRFNALFRSRYGLKPTDLRRGPARKGAAGSFTCQLAYRPPLGWEQLLGFLGARISAGVEWVDAGQYLRTVRAGQHRGWIRIGPNGHGDSLRLEISDSLAPAASAVLAGAKRMFDLGAHPLAIADHLGADAALAPLLEACPGIRVPGSFDGFETAVRAVLGQQISVKAATTLGGRLALAFGEPIETPYRELGFLSPTAARVAEATVEELRSLGMVRQRAETIRELAGRVASGTLRLEPGAGAIPGLREIRGIGEWTAQYIAMRALAWPDAFPHSDLGVRKALGIDAPKAVLERAARWSPWRAYATMLLWSAPGDSR